MKGRQKIKRIQLQMENKYNFSLLGIVSAEPDYRLSLLINRKMKISLRNSLPYELTGDDGKILHFSRFSCHTTSSDITYNLIGNKSDNEYFLKKLNKIDYLLQVSSPENEYRIDDINNTIRTIESITAVFLLNPDEIKDKNIQYLIS